MSSLSGFSKKILAIDVEKNIADNMRKYAFKLEKTIKLYSPVDTGQYRANNRITIGNKSNFYSYSTSPADNASVLNSYSDIKQPIFIQNNLPYADKIENGHSKQAENGVYNQAVKDVQFKSKALIS